MRKVLKELIASSTLPEKDKATARMVFAHICVVKYDAEVKVSKKVHKHSGLLGVSSLVDREWQIECYLLSLHPQGEVTHLVVNEYD